MPPTCLPERRHNDLKAALYLPGPAAAQDQAAGSPAGASASLAGSRRQQESGADSASGRPGPVWTQTSASAPVPLALPCGVSPVHSTHGASVPLHPLVGAQMACLPLAAATAYKWF